MELVERTDELRTLRGIFDKARRGRGSAILLSGEPGIGKTALVRTFVDELSDQIRVFWGAGEDLATPRTLGPFRDIGRDVGLTESGADLDRDALIDALLDQMAFASRPAVLVIEDVHWVDDASMDVIRYMLRRIARLPALLILTVRKGTLPADHPLRRIVAGLGQSELYRLELSGLTNGAVADIARSRGFDPDRLVSLVGGNPFYLTEVLASPGRGVPESVRDAVLVRVRSLPVETRHLLELLSVFPGEVDSSLASQVLGSARVGLGPAFEAAILVDSPHGIHFRHELTRQAIELSLPAHDRVEYNRRALRILRDLGAEPSRLVHHALAAADDEALTLHAPEAAWSALEQEGFREALAFAVAVLDRGLSVDVRTLGRLYSIAATALSALNRFGEAATLASKSVEVWAAQGDSPLELAEALLLAARLQSMFARPDEAWTKAKQAQAILEPRGPSHLLAACYATLGSQAVLRARLEEGAGLCDRALELAEALSLPDVKARALLYRGSSKVPRGDESGIADLKEGIRIAEEIDHGDYLSVGANNLGVSLIRTGRHSQAGPYLDLAEKAAREHGLDRSLFHIEGQKCHVLVMRGDWDEAERRLQDLVSGGGDPGANLAPPLALLGRLQARRGSERGEMTLRQAWDIASRSGEHQKMAVSGTAFLEWSWLRGDRHTAAMLVGVLMDQAKSGPNIYLHGEVLRYRKRLGERVSGFGGCPETFAAGLAGDWRRAADLWRKAQQPYEEALELVEAPIAEVAFRGVAQLDRLGAIVTAEVVRRQLRDRGFTRIPRGLRPRTRTNPGRLTDRQVEVVRLVAEGLTNHQIASRLFLSTRTVDNHVQAVLIALGVATRQEAAAAAARLDLV